MSSKTASGVQAPADLVQVGFVFGAYGITGGVRVRPFNSEADALLHATTWWLDKPSLRDVEVKRAKLHGGDVVTTIVGMTDRNEAEALKGAAVFVSRADFPQLQEDEYYWGDLLGLAVQNQQGESLGIVADMMSNGPQSILRVEYEADGKAQERLIPFVSQFVIRVDKDAKQIIVDWGLDY
ncbi:ribosome maturation factor RimM [Duganella sp. Root336D2]|uniref:ribosome maturation factor RimM n=1 Tax=Duganella sp. Root336D2 TaxID=1736518 RepID=UPI000701390C|nr:ribosome maturation factor RimM [Duganella sp. Root336D2]KQV45330.1 ribosome maturation factor RimM [Duganella sp. Root336D2]